MSTYSRSDEQWMGLALHLARKGEGYVSPNPMVGAVLVNNSVLVGAGYHQRYGQMHAEVAAIADAKDKSRGGTLYVTLEPCTHFGKTPPCTEAIIAAGIRRVVVAVLDPNPINTSKGVRTLREAGLTVQVGLREKQAQELNQAFFTYMRTGRPHVLIKAAASLDGRIATAAGESKWITGEAARKLSRRLRSSVDAILVGVNTVIADDPLLLPEEKRGRYCRIVLDSQLRIPPTARVCESQAEFPTLVYTTEAAAADKRAALLARGVEVLAVATTPQGVAIDQVLASLAAKEVVSVLVEGGGHVIASFMQAGCVDRLALFLAGIVIGTRRAPSWVEGEGYAHLDEALRFTIEAIERIGEDILLLARPRTKPAS